MGGSVPTQTTWLGMASVSPPGPVIAGSFGTWEIRFTVGRYGIDNTGAVKIAIRSVTDWGQPQLADPQAENHVRVHHSGAARLRSRYEPYGGIRPWCRVLLMEVYDGSLAEGDQIVATWGDTSGGSPGCRAQTYPEDAFEFRVQVDPFGTGVFETLEDSPTVPVIPGPADHLTLVAPSTLGVGAPGWAIIRIEDAWGNPTPQASVVRLTGADGLPTTLDVKPEDAGTRRIDGWSLPRAGIHRLQATDEAGRSAASNPILVERSTDNHHLLWGDTQGQSGGTIGTGTLEAFYRYARDVGALDFVVHSGNDFQINRDMWERTQRAVREYHDPPRFVTFLSYEWSGNTPAGGDHNVIFLDDEGPLHRSSHWLVPDRSDEHTDRYPIDELWREFEDRDDVIAVPHVGGRRADLSYLDERYCPVVEIASVHGHFEWLAHEALARGYRVGFVGASDDHSGRPGASGATADGKLPVRGGLAGVFASETTREGIWQALRARRCYATTGDRIALIVRSGEHWMGEAIVVDGAPQLRIEVAGAGPLDRIDILRGSKIVHTERIAPPSEAIRLAWMGARVDTRGRHLRWDGRLRLSEGRIREATAWAFDRPSDHLELIDDHEVRWRSGTSGDPDGVVLDLDAPDAATLSFETEPARLRFRVGDIGSEPIVTEIGGLEQRVVIERAPDPDASWDASFSWVDPDPVGGEQPYWVRITQIDGGRAWSSPLFITARI